MIAIIGAGPAGLAVAACLAEAGIASTVIDRGDRPFSALRRLDPEMQLLTPTTFSRLPGMTVPHGEPEHWRFGQLIEHLERWLATRPIDIQHRTVVERVERGFRLHTSRGVIEASHVVNATGIIDTPVVPDPPTRFPWMHSVDVRSGHLAAARRLVVVGAGMSSAEILERWLELRRDGDRAWLSTRKPVRAAPSRILGLDLHWYLWAPEHLPGRLLGKRLAPARDLIIGRSILPALRDGRITKVRSIDGLEPDLVVYATGFRYGTSHLGDLIDRDRDGWPIVDRHAQSRTPGLYLLGSRFGRSIASPALRGISRDAAHVARRIASDLR